MSIQNKQIKAKQKKMFFLIMAFIIGIGMFITWAKKNNEKPPVIPPSSKEAVIYERFSGISDQTDERDIWFAKSANEIDKVKKENARLRKIVEDFNSDVERRINEQVSKQTAQIREQISIEAKKNRDQELADVKKQSTNDAFFQRSQEIKEHAQKRNIIKQTYYRDPNFNSAALGNYNPDLTSSAPTKSLISITFPKANSTLPLKEDNLDAVIEDSLVKAEEVEVLTTENYVPAGTFVRAILLGGLDAPTGGQAQQDPTPIFLQIDDLASLPNNHLFDFINCRVIAFAYGDISSERAMAKLETLSCIDKSEVVHEWEVKGFIYDETGKAGVRGKLVSKQGVMLANSLLAGIGAGIGSAFNQQAISYATTPTGTVSTIDPSKIGVAGVGQGVNTALNRLAEYYIELAEQLFPIIEVSAGRALDIVFTAGFKIEKKGTRKEESDEISTDNLASFLKIPNGNQDDGLNAINQQLLNQFNLGK